MKLPNISARWQCRGNARETQTLPLWCLRLDDVTATGQSQRTLPPIQEVGANVLQPRTVSPEQAKIWVKVSQNHVFYSFNAEVQVRGDSRGVVTTLIPQQPNGDYSASCYLSDVVGKTLLQVRYMDASNGVNA